MINLKECKTAYHVYETNDYGLFSFIESNRNPSRKHVENLKRQIKNGYELPPIIVRENGEILDGQHRYIALVELEKPIQFLIKEDIRKDVLQKSNSFVSKWTINDHVNYHRKEGNQDYQDLYEFCQYSGLCANIAARILGSAKGNGITTKAIEEGKFFVKSKTDAYQFVDDVLMRIRMEHPTSKIINSLRTLYNIGTDTKTLVTVVNALEEELLMLNSINKISERIVNLYNKKVSKSEKIKVTYNKAGKAVYKL